MDELASSRLRSDGARSLAKVMLARSRDSSSPSSDSKCAGLARDGLVKRDAQLGAVTRTADHPSSRVRLQLRARWTTRARIRTAKLSDHLVRAIISFLAASARVSM
jgi:hypothetical protein